MRSWNLSYTSEFQTRMEVLFERNIFSCPFHWGCPKVLIVFPQVVDITLGLSILHLHYPWSATVSLPMPLVMLYLWFAVCLAGSSPPPLSPFRQLILSVLYYQAWKRVVRVEQTVGRGLYQLWCDNRFYNTSFAINSCKEVIVLCHLQTVQSYVIFPLF